MLEISEMHVKYLADSNEAAFNMQEQTIFLESVRAHIKKSFMKTFY